MDKPENSKDIGPLTRFILNLKIAGVKPDKEEIAKMAQDMGLTLKDMQNEVVDLDLRKTILSNGNNSSRN